MFSINYVELQCTQLVPGVYSRPGVYWLESLVYPWLLNGTGVYSEPASIRANTVYGKVLLLIHLLSYILYKLVAKSVRRLTRSE